MKKIVAAVFAAVLAGAIGSSVAAPKKAPTTKIEAAAASNCQVPRCEKNKDGRWQAINEHSCCANGDDDCPEKHMSAIKICDEGQTCGPNGVRDFVACK